MTNMQILFIIGIIALIVGIIGMPYGYYFLLKTFLFLFLGKFLFDTYKRKKNFDNFSFFLVELIIIYNPFCLAPLGKCVWTIINVITAIFLYIYCTKNKLLTNKIIVKGVYYG